MKLDYQSITVLNDKTEKKKTIKSKKKTKSTGLTC